MQFMQFSNDFEKLFMVKWVERERQNENVGNAKLESEKLIQQVFIMHAC